MNRMLIKICGLTSQEDLAFCQDLGIDLTGFIFHPSSPRFVDPQKVGTWKKKNELRVGVFVNLDTEQILSTIETARLDLIQLHGGQDQNTCRCIGSDRVIRVFWPEKHDQLNDFENELERFADVCRYYLFDAGKNMGGHGRLIDSPWVENLHSPKPFFLAGGLGPDNLQNILHLGMSGLDLNSGVEISPGVKDRDRITRVMEIVAG